MDIECSNSPATVRDLAARLGRSRQSLYYHLITLERAKLVTVTGWTGAGRDRERVYAVTRGPIAVGARLRSADLAAADRAVKALLRMTAREVSAVLLSGDLTADPGARPMAFRGKARLSEARLERLQGLIGRVQELLQAAKGGPAGCPLYALTVVLTPAREAGKTRSSKRNTRNRKP